MKKEGSKSSKINEKCVSIGLKITEKIDTKCLKMLNNTFWWKIRPIFNPSISGTKYDRDKLIFSAERGGQSDRDEA